MEKRISYGGLKDILSPRELKNILGGCNGDDDGGGGCFKCYPNASGCIVGDGCPDWLDSVCDYGWMCANCNYQPVHECY